MSSEADLDAHALAERVRALLRRGELPNDAAAETWGGPGNQQPCCVCRRSIRHAEIGFDLLFRTPHGTLELHMHLRCHTAWEHERGGSTFAPQACGACTPE